MKTMKLFSATCLGYLSFITGKYAELYLFVIAAMLLDYFTGVMAAGYNGKLNSKKASNGLYKKAGFLLLLSFGFFLDSAIPYFAESGLNMDINMGISMGLIFAAWIVLTEAISILENFVKLGINIPPYIKKMLLMAKTEVDGGEKNENIT